MKFKKNLTSKIVDSMGTENFLRDACGFECEHTSNSILFLCPFHDETDPSFAVYISSGAGKCFSCGVTADLVKIYAQIKQMSVTDTCKLLNDKFLKNGGNNE